MGKRLHIVADAHIWGAEQAFHALSGFDVQLDVVEAQAIDAKHVQDADVLLVRSSTAINAQLLKHSNVSFVGTATVGDDHVDQAYLKANNIAFASAAGSSTESVVEYMLAALYGLAQDQSLDFTQDVLGIIGVGRIGGLLQQACANMGLQTLLNDPPRQAVESSDMFSSLEYLLQHADILTLHTPLDQEGEYSTKHLLNQANLQQFQGRGIINAGRGACLDNQALLRWLQEDEAHFTILDCWENEPNISIELLQHPQTYLATPHIAGHSLDGKAANTQYVYDALCAYLNVSSTWQHQQDLPMIPECQASLIPCPTPISTPMPTDLVQQFYPIQKDSDAMKEAASRAGQFAVWFKQYRRAYPVRRSWRKMLASMDYPNDRLFF